MRRRRCLGQRFPPSGRQHDEGLDRDGCLASAGQWCGANTGRPGARRAKTRGRNRIPLAGRLLELSSTDLSWSAIGAADATADYQTHRSDEARCHPSLATEGPIGHAVRSYCLKWGRPFTTSYTTRFPEYIAARVPIPEQWIYGALRRFHAGATVLMVATPS